MQAEETVENLNAFSCELEDWFHILDSDIAPRIEQWPGPPLRAERSVQRLLELFEEYDVRATFFCLGRNVDRYPGIYQQILDEGHAVGNHSYSHLKGSQTKSTEYYDDIKLAGETIQSRLYRPPYGRFRKSQIRELRKKYQIVMWDVLSQDYDQSITPEKCLFNVMENVRPGSIVVFTIP